MTIWTHQQDNFQRIFCFWSFLKHKQFRTKQWHTQEYIPVGCLPSALYRTRVFVWGQRPLGQRLPEQRPLGQRPPWTETSPLRRNMGPESETPLKVHGTRQPNRKWHHTETPCGETNTSENITLPQTSFTDGKDLCLTCSSTELIAHHYSLFLIQSFGEKLITGLSLVRISTWFGAKPCSGWLRIDRSRPVVHWLWWGYDNLFDIEFDLILENKTTEKRQEYPVPLLPDILYWSNIFQFEHINRTIFRGYSIFEVF